MSTLLEAPIQKVNLVFKRNTGSSILLTVLDAVDAPITVTTGYSVRAQIRDRRSGDLLFEWNTTSGTGIGIATFTYTAPTLPATVGKSVVQLTVTAAQTALFDFWLADWDCYLTSPANQSVCLAEGTATVDRSITH